MKQRNTYKAKEVCKDDFTFYHSCDGVWCMCEAFARTAVELAKELGIELTDFPQHRD